MSKISSLMATETVVDVEFPDVEGFIISLVYLTREDLMKIRNTSLTFKFNKRTRQREEEIDNDKFLAEYTRRAVKGWKGLKVKHLPNLLLIWRWLVLPKASFPLEIQALGLLHPILH